LAVLAAVADMHISLSQLQQVKYSVIAQAVAGKAAIILVVKTVLSVVIQYFGDQQALLRTV